tara:strand:+ start:84 stop:392 length:309 start_codon:yes stop_codon:yes gene_type:complete
MKIKIPKDKLIQIIKEEVSLGGLGLSGNSDYFFSSTSRGREPSKNNDIPLDVNDVADQVRALLVPLMEEGFGDVALNDAAEAAAEVLVYHTEKPAVKHRMYE